MINYRDKLPVEIWHYIFEIQAAQAEAHRILAEDFNSPNSTLEADPYAVPENLDSGQLAASCHFFESVLAKIPAAWRRVLVFLDDDEPQRTLETYAERLQKGGVNATDILITRRHWHALATRPSSAPKVPLDPTEKEKVRAILPTIYQLASFATSLTIQTISGDSLPHINCFCFVQYPDLHTLVLDCLVRGSGTLLPAISHPANPADISLPSVHKLSLTGPNFGYLFRNLLWNDWYLEETNGPGPYIDSPRFTKLRISHWRDADGFNSSGERILGTDGLIEALFIGCRYEAELAHADCEKITFDIDPEDMSPPQYSTMTLENVSRNIIYSYLECMKEPWAEDEVNSPSEFTHKIVDYTFGYIPALLEDSALIHRDSIVVVRVSDEETLKSCFTLAAKDVYGLWVSDCSGFTDSVIAYLGLDWRRNFKFRPGTTGQLDIPNLRSLYLNNCPQITIGALRSFVEDRNTVWAFEEVEEEGRLFYVFQEVPSNFASEISHHDVPLKDPASQYILDQEQEFREMASDSPDKAAKDDGDNEDDWDRQRG
ncbi:hypothetical protein DFP72DRAFT_1112515 [Ephemerocybe angulata]|uniref:Uncharacterized protein n=1 Tax=Ephemerocybe angulata TaxID=980116 RepID=A0A8H6H9D5_9AGAR|nr:hypothetical protein DFP72DRAFT_1112515 [Tulosesus angulatus]